MQHTPYYNLNLPDGTDRVDIEALNGNSEIIDTAMEQIRTKAEAPVYYSQVLGVPDSLPASDVYPWAKKGTKPSYTAQEVGSMSSTEIITLVNDVRSDVEVVEQEIENIQPIPDSFIDDLFGI